MANFPQSFPLKYKELDLEERKFLFWMFHLPDISTVRMLEKDTWLTSTINGLWMTITLFLTGTDE